MMSSSISEGWTSWRFLPKRPELRVHEDPLSSRLPQAGQQVALGLHRHDLKGRRLRREKSPPKGAAFPRRCCYSGSSAPSDQAGARKGPVPPARLPRKAKEP